MTHQNPTPNTYVLDASDRLNRARQILEFVLDWYTQDRDNDPGVGWTLAEVQTGIVDTLSLLNSAGARDAASHKVQRAAATPQTRTNNDLERASAIWELASKLKAHFDGLPHADQTGVLSQADGATLAYALVVMAEAAFEDLSGDRK